VNPRLSPLVRVVDGLLELCWLLIVLAVPGFFNVRDYRVFEPDKIVLMRDGVLIMVILFLVKAVYLTPHYLARWSGVGEDKQSFGADLTEGLRRRPMAVAALAFAFVYLLATFRSLLPAISFWGSYDRMEGAYTYLTYITLFLLMASHIRSWTQCERLATAVILASVPPSVYSWAQHFKVDPLIWGGSGDDASLRTPSTLGNPIFLGGYLLMAVPFTLYRLVQRVVRCLQPPDTSDGQGLTMGLYLGTVGYGAALSLQLGAIGFSGSRGPALGLLAALVVYGLVIALRFQIKLLLRAAIAFTVLLVLVFGATNTVFKRADTPHAGFTRFLYLLPSESGTSEVRSLLWKSAPSLFKAHPVTGCGPEVLIYCWYPYYPTGLRSVELANAAPDRSHNEDIDILITTGILGALAYLALLATMAMSLYRVIKRSADLRTLTFCAALAAAFAGHLVEAFVGIAFSATLLMFWVIAAAATALDSGTLAPGSGFAAGGGGSLLAAAGRQPAAELSIEEPVAGPHRANRRQGTRQRMPAGRRATERVSGYSAFAVANRLRPGTRLLWSLISLIAVALIVLAGAQFVANTQLIQADADYRLGQGYEAAAGQNVTSTTTLQVAEATYQGAIASYQDAINALPTWNGTPIYDEYRLFLGKTYLEYANALELDLQHTVSQSVTPSLVTQTLQEALAVFQSASHSNPLNPDHPRNIAKLYVSWAQLAGGTPALDKLRLADASFQQAARLAPHNADILDEWSAVNMTIGDSFPSEARTQYALALTHLTHALELFPADSSVFRDLGYVYNRYAEFALAAHQPAAAHRYYLLARDNWLQGIQRGATNTARVYPRLTYLYYTQLKDYCAAAKYSQLGLQAISSGALADSTGNLGRTFQQVIAQAKTHRCQVGP
jgi:tetratricopeptide (TPR) repeat protein